MTLHAAVAPVRSVVSPRTLEPELHLGTAPGARAGSGGQLRVPLSALTRRLHVTGAADEVAGIIARLLSQLDVAGVPWLRVGGRPARAGDRSSGARDQPAPAVTVIDLTDPHGVPLTLDPLRPEPGYPVAAHVGALCAVLQAAFGLPDQGRDVLALALRRGYTALSGDGALSADGAGKPAVAAGPAVLTLAQLDRAVVHAARELGYGDAMTTALHGLIRGRLGGLCGPATGLLLAGGHPANTRELLSRNVHVVTGEVDGPEGRALLSGAIALRVVEHARPPARAAGAGLRHVLVIEDAGPLAGGSPAARQFGRLLDAAAARGAGIVVTEHAPSAAAPWLAGSVALTSARDPGAATEMVSRQEPGRPGASVHAPPRVLSQLALPGRHPSVTAQPSLDGLIRGRSAGCGRICGGERACTRHEIWLAAGLADASDAAAAWLRLWVRALLLGFLTGCHLPSAPPPLRAVWAAQHPRLRECALATVVDRTVGSRAAALRDCYPPEALIRVMARTGADMLGGRPAPRVAGQVWVPPQLRWAHEAARVGWGDRADRDSRGTVRPGDAAPPLDFALAGLPDWPGIPAAERLRLLLRHPLSLTRRRNRELASIAVYGEDGRDAFETALAADLATAEATRTPDGLADWLVAVLERAVTG